MMNRNMLNRWITFSFLSALAIVSCNFAAALASPTPEPTTATQIIPTQPQSTATVAQPTLTVTVVQETAIVASPSPVCTVLQDLNFRFGPGTAYRPPIRALPANSFVTPLGYVPQGIPSGSWVYVRDVATKAEGWVNAGAQYISCTVEVTALPSAAFGTPPPPPLPKSAQSSDPDGSGFCVDPDSQYKCVGTFSNEFLFQFQVIRNGIEQTENDGVKPVAFTVTKDGDLIYSTVENNAAYCIFGGNGPCTSWAVEDGVYKWKPAGLPIEPGEYKVGVDVTVNGDDSHWEVFFKVTLP